MLLQKLIRSARPSQTRRQNRKALNLESLERRELMTAAGAVCSDYGDAPDGGTTGYPDGFADVGSFPTLASSGGAVALDTSQAILGDTVTVESDSVQAGDSDDGLINFALPLTSIPPTAVMSVAVTGPDGSDGGTYWINVLIDLNLDGAWNGVVAEGLNEWVVINQPVSVAAGVTTEIDLPAFNFAVPPGNGLPDGAWMRVALTDSPIMPTTATWDGSGVFAAGEIEDHVILIPDLGGNPDEPKSFIPTASQIPDKVFFPRGKRIVSFSGRYSNIGTTGGTGGFNLDRDDGGVRIVGWRGRVFRNCAFPNPDARCTTVRMGARSFGDFTFFAMRGEPLPSQFTWTAYGIDPPAVILPEGVILGFTESVGTIEFHDAPLGDITGDGLVTWDDYQLVEEQLGQVAERDRQPPVLFTFDASGETDVVINTGSVGADHDAWMIGEYDANSREGAIVGDESLRIFNSRSVLDTFWTSANDGESPFTVGTFVRPERAIDGSFRLFGANHQQDGWQVRLVDLGDGLMAVRAEAGGTKDILEVVLENEMNDSSALYVALSSDGAGVATLHVFHDGDHIKSVDGAFEFDPTDANLTLGAQPDVTRGLAGSYDDFTIWEQEVDFDLLQQIAVFGVEEATTLYLEGDADTNGVVNRADLDVVRQAIGDLNEDGAVDAADITTMCQAIEIGDTQYDFNKDRRVDGDDLDFFILDLLGTNYGDANLDGTFDSPDLVQVFQAGKYETGAPADWSSGDWDCDGDFDSGDLVQAFIDGGYTPGARPWSEISAIAAATDRAFAGV